MHFQLGSEVVAIWSSPPYDQLFTTTGLSGTFVFVEEKDRTNN